MSNDFRIPLAISLDTWTGRFPTHFQDLPFHCFPCNFLSIPFTLIFIYSYVCVSGHVSASIHRPLLHKLQWKGSHSLSGLFYLSFLSYLVFRICGVSRLDQLSNLSCIVVLCCLNYSDVVLRLWRRFSHPSHDILPPRDMCINIMYFCILCDINEAFEAECISVSWKLQIIPCEETRGKFARFLVGATILGFSNILAFFVSVCSVFRENS